MNIRIPVTQIPAMWEAIKFVALETDNVASEDIQRYCNGLLIKLLCDKTQVIVKIDNERNIEAMMIIDYSRSNITGLTTLHFRNFYSWRGHTIAEWDEALQTIKEFAKEEGCSFIEAISYNKQVWKLTEEIGFKESARQYLLEL